MCISLVVCLIVDKYYYVNKNRCGLLDFKIQQVVWNRQHNRAYRLQILQ